jgi:excisionase family DNA binding protein
MDCTSKAPDCRTPKGAAAMSVDRQKLLYDVAEAAHRLGVKPSWLYERTRRNGLPCRRLGKYVRFSDADLLAIMESAKVDA